MAVEYGFIAGLIAVVILGGGPLVGTILDATFEEMSGVLK